MMSIFQYIRKYGKYKFFEKQFNEIDNVILSCLSYIDFEVFNRTLKEAGKIFFNKHSKKELRYSVSEEKNAIKLLRFCMKSERYKNILIKNYQRVYTDTTQFQAINFILKDNLAYISFSGTNHLISGWEEDYRMAYKYPVEAQRLAIHFLNKNFLFGKEKLIVGGHSKGGNLAITAAMYSFVTIRNKIINIYSNDGLGILKRQLDSKYYKRIEDKVIKLIPDYSIVGLLLYSNDYKVIKSINRNFFAHNPNGWIVNEDTFMDGDLSDFSKVISESISKWFNDYTLDEQEKFGKHIFDVFRKLEINSIKDIKKKKKLLFYMMIESKNVNYSVKKMSKQFIDTFKECYKEYKNNQEKS